MTGKIKSIKNILEAYPLDKETADFVKQSRQIISNIISKKDNRLLVIVGPCSIHNSKEALDYAKKLKEISDKNKNIYVVMRTYFEKPRTTIGWKGFVQDPDLDNSCDIEKGIIEARKLLIEINKMGLPCASEFLNPIVTYYYQDLISYGAIGARTTESQIHRELVSGLDFPVGFKNNTDGNIDVAVAGVVSSSCSHSFLAIDENSYVFQKRTNGNKFAHIILRGGTNGPNYEKKYVEQAEKLLEKNNIQNGIIVDCSHANSNKIAQNQLGVLENIIKQKKQGNKSIVGVMIESNINFGKQSFTPGKDSLENLQYGVSITDECISLEITKDILKNL